MPEQSHIVDWNTEHVIAVFGKASMEALTALGFVGEGKVKAKIIANDQFDTGNMLNSVYVVAPGKTDYDENMAKAQAASAAAGKIRNNASAVTLPGDNVVALAVAAEYAIFQEMLHPFLYPSLESLSTEFKGVVERFKK